LFQVRKVEKRLDLRAGFVAGQDTLVSDVLAHAGLLMKQNPGKKVFMICDSLQTLNDGKYADGAINSMTQVRVTEMITDFCKETYATALIVGQVTKSGDFGGKMQVKHTVDVHAHLFLDENKKSETYGERIFEVQKNRFGCGNRSYVLGIGKQGLYEKGQIQMGNF
jgi:predicted ATP-dependent serine protease